MIHTKIALMGTWQKTTKTLKIYRQTLNDSKVVLSNINNLLSFFELLTNSHLFVIVLQYIDIDIR